MAHGLHDIPQRIFDTIKSAVSTFLLIVFYYILQYIFDMHFVCSCRPGLHWNGVLYLACPPLIITLVVNFIEPFQAWRRFSSWHFIICNCCNGHFCGHIMKLFSMYISLGAVWVATVLFDGDWYFCLKTNFNTSQTGLPCKKDLTYDEERIRDAYKTDSLDWGFLVIGCLLIIWSTVEIRRAYCVPKRTWRRSRCDLCPPYYSVLYEAALAEEVSSHLNKGLRKIAEEKAEAICKPYIEAVRNHEMPDNNTSEYSEGTGISLPDVWSTISSSDFYCTESSTQEDSHTYRHTLAPNHDASCIVF